MKRESICAGLAALAVICGGCSGNNTAHSSTPARTATTASPSAAIGLAPDMQHFKPMSNGQAIFLSGRDLAGHRIRAVPPPMRPSCAACHTPTGAGGVHLPGGAVSADLRYNALVNGQKTPYTVALLERAISTGVDNEGEKLDPAMPRWKMSAKDLHDVAAYVMTLR